MNININIVNTLIQELKLEYTLINNTVEYSDDKKGTIKKLNLINKCINDLILLTISIEDRAVKVIKEAKKEKEVKPQKVRKYD